jgi:hypothetical protein
MEPRCDNRGSSMPKFDTKWHGVGERMRQRFEFQSNKKGFNTFLLIFLVFLYSYVLKSIFSCLIWEILVSLSEKTRNSALSLADP